MKKTNQLLITIFIFSFILVSSYGQEKEGPVGGGEGYSNIITEGMADVVITTNDWQSLKIALDTAVSGDIVYIKGDLEISSNLSNVFVSGNGENCLAYVKPGVTLASNRGYNNSRGATLIQDSFTNENVCMLALGNNARITGINLRGPDIIQDDDPLYYTDRCPNGEDYQGNSSQSGINIETYTTAEIDNCELYGWPFAAIRVIWSGDTFQQYIHHNKIYRNSKCGMAYGVGLNGPTNTIIENNIFYYNKHSISGDGYISQNYSAYYNLILNRSREVMAQAFDMHGYFEKLNQGHFNYGGNSINIENNTFVADFPAIKIRGEQKGITTIKNNNFKEPNDSCQSILHMLKGTKYYTDSSGEIVAGLIPVPSCPSDFLGTKFILENNNFNLQNMMVWKTSWGGKSQWQPLSHAIIDINKLGFGDFDGDGKTDIFFNYDGYWHIAYSGNTPIRKLIQSSLTAQYFAYKDFDGDGLADLLFASGEHIYIAYKIKWEARLSAFTALYTNKVIENCALSLSELRFGDFDGDGKCDIICRDSDNGFLKVAYSVGRGEMFEDFELINYTSIDISNLVVHDYNNDGKCDFLYHDATYQKINVGYSNGRGNSISNWTPVLFGTSIPIQNLAFYDFNGDSLIDIFHHDNIVNKFKVAYNRKGNTADGWHSINSSSIPLENLRFGDFNGDEKTDIFTVSSMNNTILPIPAILNSVDKYYTTIPLKKDTRYKRNITVYPNPIYNEINVR